MSGILSYATYLPYYRLQRAAIAATLGGPPGQGHPRRGLVRRGLDFDGGGRRPAPAGRLSPATWPPSTSRRPSPAYLDKTNATAIHAALGLPAGVGAYDMGGAVRSAVGALRAALLLHRNRRWWWPPTSAPACRAATTSATAATAPRPSWSARASDAHPVLAECLAVGVGHRRVPGALAGARRDVLPPVGGALRGPCPPAPRGPGGDRRPGTGPGWPPTPSSTSSSPAPTPGRSALFARMSRGEARDGGRRPEPPPSATPGRRTPGCSSPRRSTRRSPGR